MEADNAVRANSILGMFGGLIRSALNGCMLKGESATAVLSSAIPNVAEHAGSLAPGVQPEAAPLTLIQRWVSAVHSHQLVGRHCSIYPDSEPSTHAGIAPWSEIH